MILLRVFCVLYLFVGLLAFDVPKILWVYWDDDLANAPSTIQMTVENMHYHLNGTGWTINVISKDTVFNYLSNKERYNHLVNNAKVEMTVHKFADYTRLSVIQEHGGVYMDITCILTENMKWLENIENNTEVRIRVCRS